MVVATIPPADYLAPWWTQEKCRSHHPWPSMLAANRAAELHPIHARFCSKCAEGREINAFRCHSDPSHFHIGHGDIRRTEGRPMTTPVPIKRRPARPGSKLDEIKAREIYTLLRQGVIREAIAYRYGIDTSMVQKIGDGERWAKATADLREMPSVPPLDIPAPQEAFAMKITTPPTEFDTSTPEPLPPLSPVAPAPAIDVNLYGAMADALEFLLLHVGKPLPVFVTINTDVIGQMVAQARSQS